MESITFRDLSPFPHFQKYKAACFTSIGRLDLPLCVEKAELGLWLLFLDVVQPKRTNNTGRNLSRLQNMEKSAKK